MKKPIIGFLFKHWWKIVVGGILAGFFTELLNTYVFQWWIYNNPRNIFFLPPIPIGAPLIVGWLFMSSLALFITIVFENIRPRTSFQLYWVLSWIIMGFVLEFFNSNIWQTWQYASGTLWSRMIIPTFNFSIFVPIVGWGATGLITFWIHKYFIASFGKGPHRCPVCWMKVNKTKKLSMMYKGKIFYFCNQSCKLVFKENPKRVVRRN